MAAAAAWRRTAMAAVVAMATAMAATMAATLTAVAGMKTTRATVMVGDCRRPIGPTYVVGPWTHEYRKKKQHRFLITEKL